MSKEPKEIRIHGGSTKKELNPDLFNGKRLKDNIREALILIGTKFEEFLGFENPPTLLKIVGSSINYNWSKKSDIDLHLVYDFKSFNHCPDEETIRDLVLSKKTIFNLKHDIKIFGLQVELYVEDIHDENKSSAVYSLTDNIWVREPVHTDPEVDRHYVTSTTSYYMKFIDKVEQMPTSKNKLDVAEKLKDKIMNLRKKGLSDSGEFNKYNVMYKTLRNYNYITKLSEIILKTEDELLSIEEPKKV